MPTISFSLPGMLRGVSEDVLELCIRRPRKCSKWAARMYLYILNLKAQFTADVLSQNMPMCLPLMHISYSSKSHPSTTPENSRSLMKMVPVGFAGEFMLHLTLSDHSICQMAGARLSVPAVQTSPAPIWHTSVYPMEYR
eukprot:15361162-Ditylum_brightwellii.AAC.1